MAVRDLPCIRAWRVPSAVYYRWLGDPAHDMVPGYATSIEGVGALVLSPDETKVLLVWEYGSWKHVGGAIDEGESVLTTLARECREEVGIELDAAFAPVSVGGWQISRARDDVVNDNFRAFVVRAASEEVHCDMNEISQAKWFDAKELLAAVRHAGSPDPQQTSTIPATPALAAAHDLGDNRRKLNAKALDWLMTYASGSGQRCRVQKVRRTRRRSAAHALPSLAPPQRSHAVVDCRALAVGWTWAWGDCVHQR